MARRVAPELSLSIGQSWLLGVSAPLARLNGQRLDVLGGAPRGGAPTYRMLRGLGIVTGLEAQARIDALLERAPRAERPSWDLVRAAAWAGAAYAAFMLDAREAWSLVERAGAIARSRYRSWEAYGADFVLGRQAFHGKPGRGKDDEARIVAALAVEGTSPWMIAPWKTRAARVAPPVHHGRVLHVGKGREHTTIDRALRAAGDGDVLEIDAGTYLESLKPEVDVELVGKGRVVVVSRADHALFVDDVGVVARNIAWESTSNDRAAVCVRARGVLRLEHCRVQSRTQGVAVYDPDTMAFFDDVLLEGVGIGVSVYDRAWLHATRLAVVQSSRLGVSAEKESDVTLDECTVVGAKEAGLLVDGAKATARCCSFTKGGWSGAQVSGGELTMASCVIENVDTGILVRGGGARLEEVRIGKTSRNGLEIAAKARVTATKLGLKGVKGSGVLVADAELELSESRIDGVVFDGVTIVGSRRVQLRDVAIASAGRAAIWLDDGSANAAGTKIDIRAADIGVRVGKDARFALAASSIRRGTTGLAIDGGVMAVESSRIQGPSANAVQLSGGASLVLATCDVVGGENAVAAVDSRAVIVGSRVSGKACALTIEGKANVVIEGGAIIGGSDVALRIDGPARARAHDTEIVSGRKGERRGSAASRFAMSRCTSRQKSGFRPELDGGLAPFTLVLHLGPLYSLVTSDFRALLGRRRSAFERRLEPNGHGIAAWIDALLDADPKLRRRIELDPEAAMFSAVSKDRDALVALVAAVRTALGDDARFVATLGAARAS
ncbi:MAG: DUF1266 domain-containing protein [Labilithrix sp.]|nr:DUF1266 domain-containing protein [Labilithrix sp.]